MIYVIETERFIKIGCSVNIRRRLSQLRSYKPTVFGPIRYLGYMDGGLDLEIKLHQPIWGHRASIISGWYTLDWYHRNEEVDGYVASLPLISGIPEQPGKVK